jgi:TRAP-type C4-dicarboxylate transport system substrate-binding protein
MSSSTSVDRRSVLRGALGACAAVLVAGWVTQAAAQQTLRLSHQWSTNDVRHKVAEILSDELDKADVGLKLQIFPNQSLFKANDQWGAVASGRLDMTLIPLSYAGGRHPEVNLTLMPGLVKNHEHAKRLNESAFMDKLEEVMHKAGAVTVVKGWLAGGFASKRNCILEPEDVRGQQMRAAGKAFEQLVAGAGASIASMPSSEIYSAMQTGVLDAVNTSSSSFVSFRLYEQVKCYTPAAEYALWFMYQPVMMSKRSYDRLNDAQKAALADAARKAEAFYAAEAAKEDADSVEVFRKAGVEVREMNAEQFAKWRALAETTSYKAFAEEVRGGKELLDLALSVE